MSALQRIGKRRFDRSLIFFGCRSSQSNSATAMLTSTYQNPWEAQALQNASPMLTREDACSLPARIHDVCCQIAKTNTERF
jgi:hypothetical protein